MKKSSFIKKLTVLAIGAIVISISACKSAPLAVEVNPLDILDSESSFYMAIPRKADPELIKRVVQNNIDGLSDSNAQLLTDHINKVYCGLNRTRKSTTIQATIDASIPQKYVSKVLNKKNGFSQSVFSPEKSSNTYEVYSQDGLDLAAPSGKVLCLGRDINTLLTNYDTIYTTAEPNYTGTEYSPLEPELYNYLYNADSEIRFFANKPQSFLTILTGTNLDLKLIDVSGSFICDPKHNDQYLLNLHFNFKNEKFLKAGKVLLTLAFGLTDSQSYIEGEDQLFINGIKIKKEQLYKLLVL